MPSRRGSCGPGGRPDAQPAAPPPQPFRHRAPPATYSCRQRSGNRFVVWYRPGRTPGRDSNSRVVAGSSGWGLEDRTGGGSVPGGVRSVAGGSSHPDPRGGLGFDHRSPPSTLRARSRLVGSPRFSTVRRPVYRSHDRPRTRALTSGNSWYSPRDLRPEYGAEREDSAGLSAKRLSRSADSPQVDPHTDVASAGSTFIILRTSRHTDCYD
jgi:hypothetical protein